MAIITNNGLTLLNLRLDASDFFLDFLEFIYFSSTLGEENDPTFN